ncbi:MAG TPA: polysaccharide biosynthesis protein [Gammaproteobacteria bacterium]|nr:polysaccharide biosynthesis protein [Gammaproteobacteria bacterium]
MVAVSIMVVGAEIALTNLGDLFGWGNIQLGWFAFPFTLIAVIGAINALNMVDGVDGLAGSLSLIALISMGLLAWQGGRALEAWTALLFSVSIIPYLLCNLSVCGRKRRIFLGDGGSMVLGFVIAWLAIALSQPEVGTARQAVFAPVTALWLFAVPLVDTVAIMVRRLIKGQSPFLPDRDHLHHIVLRMGYRDRHALLFIILAALVLAGAGLWMEFAGVAESLRFMLFLGFALLYMVLLQYIWRVIRGVRTAVRSMRYVVWKLLLPLASLSRLTKQGVLFVADGTSVYLSLAIALQLHYGEWDTVARFFEGPLSLGLWTAPLLAFPVFGWFGLYRSIIRYFGSRALWSVTGAVMLYGLLYAAGWLLFSSSGVADGQVLLPGTVLLLHVLMLLLMIGGARMVARKLLQLQWGGLGLESAQRRVLIIGAGDAGCQLASGLHQAGGYQLVGFVDDNRDREGRLLSGLPVIASSALEQFIDQHEVTDVLLATEELDGINGQLERNQLLQRLRGLQVRVREVPQIEALVSGKIGLEDVKELNVADLLQRQPVWLDVVQVEQQVSGKTMLVCGAGSLVGQSLCQEIINYRPKLLLLYEQDDKALNQLHQLLLLKLKRLEQAYLQQVGEQDQLINAHSSSAGKSAMRGVRLLPRIVPLLGSLRDQQRVTEIVTTWRPQILFYAEESHDELLMEQNLVEGVKGSLLTSWSLAQVAIEQAVPRFIMVSTDRTAVPGQAISAIKQVTDRVVQSLGSHSELRFDPQSEPSSRTHRKTQLSIVQMGHLLERSSPLITRLRNQISRGGAITLPDPEQLRYFLTGHEAAQLILGALVLLDETTTEVKMNGGGANVPVTFVLDMGEPVKIVELARRMKIVELARRMVELSGLRVKDERSPEGDIEIEFTGLRSEQRFEKPITDDQARATSHPQIMQLLPDYLPWESLESQLRTLQIAAENGDVEMIRALLSQLVEEYQPDERVADWVYREQMSRKK